MKNKIKAVASACLCGIPCRYDGKTKLNKKIFALMKKGEIFPLCPEVMAGLPIPRPVTDITDGKVIKKNGKDVTAIYQNGAELALKVCVGLKIKKAYLKKGSPTCGEKGVFAKLLKKKKVDIKFLDKS